MLSTSIGITDSKVDTQRELLRLITSYFSNVELFEYQFDLARVFHMLKTRSQKTEEPPFLNSRVTEQYVEPLLIFWQHC